MSDKRILIYKFYPLDSAIKSLLTSKLKISRLNELNDPFEIDYFNINGEFDRVLWSKGAKVIGNTLGFISFCGDWSNPLLWAHYADCHRGMCLGFEVDEEEAVPVKYVAERKPLQSIEEFIAARNMGEMISLLTTKFDEWRYERERRVFCKIDKNLPDHQMQFEPFSTKYSLKSVILGLRCNLNVSDIQKLVPSSVEIVQSRKSDTEFKMCSLTDWRAGLIGEKR